MSRAAKATLAATSSMAVGIVWFVHWAQQNDKTVRKSVLAIYLPIIPLTLTQHCKYHQLRSRR